MRYLFNRLKEASTWRGLVLVATALGVQLTPDQVSTVVAAGLAVSGLIGAFFPDSEASPPK